MDPAGALVWETDLGPPMVAESFLAGIAAGPDGSTVMNEVWTDGGPHARQFKLDPGGAVVWDHTDSAYVFVSAINAQGAMAGARADELVALAADGGLQWSHERSIVDARWIAIGPDGSVALATTSGVHAAVTRYAADGELVWDREVVPTSGLTAPGDFAMNSSGEIALGLQSSNLLYVVKLDPEGQTQAVHSCCVTSPSVHVAIDAAGAVYLHGDSPNGPAFRFVAAFE